MNKKFIRCLSMLMAVLMVATSINLSAFAQEITYGPALIGDIPAEIGPEAVSEVTVSCEIPGEVLLGTELSTILQIKSEHPVASVAAWYNGTELEVGDDRRVVFTVEEKGQNVLNIKVFDHEGAYTEKVIHVNGIADEADPEAVCDSGAPAEAETVVGALHSGAVGERSIMAMAMTATVNITSPAVQAVITEPAEIKGTVSGAGMTRYTLEYADATSVYEDPVTPEQIQAVEDAYTVFAEGTSPVSGGVLGIFDPTRLMNGFYSIRLTAYGSGGEKQSTTVVVSVEGNMKLGNFSASFIDMDIPVAGYPVTVIREYDSRNRDKSGDFGYGWDMNLAGATITVSGHPGKGWPIKTKSGSFGMNTFYFDPSYPHQVSINWGNGKVDKFDMTPNPNQSTIYKLEILNGIRYTALNGTKNKLEAVGGTGSFLANGEAIMHTRDLSFYNPTQYILTKPDGTKFYFDVKLGLYEIRDTQGNIITIKQSGITHSDGQSIVFTRDGEGRITGITGSNGKTLSYDYDGSGNLVKVTDPAGNETSFTYDSDHYMEEIIDPRGVTLSRNVYDDNGRLVAVVDAGGNRTTLTSDPDNRLETVTDRLGNSTVYEYDNRGNIIRITDAGGNVTRYTFDANNNPTSKVDALGNTTQYTYDRDGNLLTMTNPLGQKLQNTYSAKNFVTSVKMFGIQQLTYTYDTDGRMTQVKDAMNHITTYAYTETGMLESISDSIGVRQTFTYDDKGNVTSYVNGNGDVATFTYNADGEALTKSVIRAGDAAAITESYQYDPAGNVSKVIYSDGSFVNREYNEVGMLTAAEDSEGRRNTYQYDLFGNLTGVNYYDGTFESFTYDREHRNITATDRQGITMTMAYDNVGNLLSKTYPNGSAETYTYDSVYRLTGKESVSGAVTSYEYDANGRNTAIVDGLGNRTVFTYNTYSQVSKVTDPRGNATSYTYDKNGRCTQVKLANAKTIVSTYDARGRLLTQKDPNSRVTTYTYDLADRLTSVKDPLGQTWSYGYNNVGELTSVTDPKGNQTVYEYDNFGRIVRTVNALGQEATVTYDARGNLVSSVDFGGTLTRFAYDNKDRLISQTAGSDVTRFTYTAQGLPETVVTGEGTTRYTYNDIGLMASEQKPDGRIIAYGYDSAYRLAAMTTTYGTTSYEYDLLDRLVKVTDQNGQVTAYTYDAGGNLLTTAYPNGLTTTYIYNNVNALTGEQIRNAQNAIVHEYVYTVGAAGERTKVTETGGRSVTYTYDALYRLTKEVTVQSGVTATTEYTYDAVSNRLTKKTGGVTTSYTYNALNQLTGEGNIIYTYDGAGNRTGKVDGSETATYVYDGSNRLIRATVQEGQNVTIEEYGYDWQGNRTKKVTEGDTVNYLVMTNNWISHVVAETGSTGNLLAYYTRGGDQLISQTRGSETSFYLYDGHGSVRMLADSSGTVTDTYTYDAYGVMTAKTGQTENSYLYAGEAYDRTTELYYLRARYMDPAAGVFLSMDTYQGNMHDPASLHKYMYANANPITNTDPTGYFSYGDVQTAMGIDNILEGARNQNYFQMLVGIRKAVNFIRMTSGFINAFTSALLGDTEGALMHLANGIIAFADYSGICGWAAVAKTLTKVLAAYDIYTRMDKMSEAVDNGDFLGVVWQSAMITMDILTITSTCFDGDTLVAAEEGQKRIDEIEAGDYVWAYNVETDELELKEVLTVYVKENDEILHLKTTEGDIDTTTNHPFYVIGKGWVAAGDLAVGDEVLTIDGPVGYVLSFELEKLDEPIPVYNIEVDDFHTYFVGDGNGWVLVHNQYGETKRPEVTAGKNFKKHFIDHKHLLERITGNKYISYKMPESFLNDIGNIIEDGTVIFEGKGTLNRSSEILNIFRGNGIIVALKQNGEWVTILQEGSGMAKNIMFVE